MAVVGHTDMTMKNRLSKEDTLQLEAAAVHTHSVIADTTLLRLDRICTAGPVC